MGGDTDRRGSALAENFVVEGQVCVPALVSFPEQILHNGQPLALEHHAAMLCNYYILRCGEMSKLRPAYICRLAALQQRFFGANVSGIER